MLFNNDWDDILKDEIHKEYFMTILYELRELYKTKDIFPPQKQIFNAFHLPYKDVKVVILGQDPYHGVGEAHGFAFSTLSSKLPPSLKNIYKELYDDLGVLPKDNGDLTGWALQGVLLLNSVLTVEKDKAASHRNLGWELLTDYIIKILNLKEETVVFILWGNFAKEKAKLITNPHHYIVMSPHPSPFSAYSGFFGSKPFSKTNEFLVKNGLTPIDWSK